MFPDIVLGAFIPLAIATFFVTSPLRAALAVMLGGAMFLPVGPFFHVPFLPPLNKHNLPILCILIGCLLRCPGRMAKLPKENWFLVLSLLAVVGGLVTGLTNGDAMTLNRAGTKFIVGLTAKDGLAQGVSLFIEACLTFFLGNALIRDQASAQRMVAAFALAGLIYAPLALLEVRLSPQLHGWVYGIAFVSWEQTQRWGGYRPNVFMPHGLALARFFMAATLATFLLAKNRRRVFSLPALPVAWFLALVLVLCKSTGAIVLTLVGILLIWFLRPRAQLLFAAVTAVATMLYPLLRSANLFPVADILNVAGLIQADRQQSLWFRFVNEDMLLAHARERIAFGWGTYGRNAVYSSWGQNISVTDGYWIIVLGIAGIAGFLVAFGNLVVPVVLARKRILACEDERHRRLAAGLAVVVVLLTVDLIPNGLWDFYPFFMAGALLGQFRGPKTA